MSGKTLFLVFAVMLLVIGGVVFVLASVIGPSIFTPVQASNAVSAAPENQNSGISSTPTVAVPKETLVPKVVETPKPLPTETQVPPTETKIPFPTPTGIVTVDPERTWPEFPTGTPPTILPKNIHTLPSFPKSLYGVTGNYFQNIEKIVAQEDGFKVQGFWTVSKVTIEITGEDSDWIYLSLNSVGIRVKVGTFLQITFVPEGLTPSAAMLTPGVTTVFFDPSERKFAVYPEGDQGLFVPTSAYDVFVYYDGKIEVRPVYYDFTRTREDYCSASYNDASLSSWSWEGSLIVHDPRIEGCPIVQLVK